MSISSDVGMKFVVSGYREAAEDDGAAGLTDQGT